MFTKKVCLLFSPPIDPKKWIRLRTNGVKSTITIKEIINNQVIDGTKELEVEISEYIT